MREFGQTTVDFFFIVLALLLVYETLQFVIIEFEETQVNRTLSAQEKNTTENLSTIISASAILNQTNAKVQINYSIPLLNDPGKGDGRSCKLTLAGNTASLSTTLDDDNVITRTTDYILPAGFTFDSGTVDCDDTVIIEKT